MGQEALMKITQDFKENKKAKSELLASGKKTRNNVRYDANELSFGDETEDDDDDEMFNDPDWHQTPLIKRLKKIRDTNNTQANKRKLGETFSEGETENAGAEANGAPRAKRSSVSGVCGCKNGCKTKRCSCVKSGKGCSDTCKCPLAQCGNRGDRPEGNPEGPPSSNDNTVLSDMSNNTTAGTMSLLNDTYQIPDDSEAIKRKITPAMLFVNDEKITSPDAPKKLQIPNESVFKSPFSRTLSPTEISPASDSRNTLTATKLFKSPLRD